MISIVIILIALNVLFSWQAFEKHELREKMLFIPYNVKHLNERYRLFSHSWIHADWQHLLFNMMSLYFLGQILSKQWNEIYGPEKGISLFILLYLIGGVAATIIPYLRNQDNSSYRSLGASGAVSAVIFAAILWNPTMKLMLIFIPIPIPAYLFGPIYLLIEYYAMRKVKSGIAHDAHIGGALFGILFVLLLNFEKGKSFLHLFF